MLQGVGGTFMARICYSRCSIWGVVLYGMHTWHHQGAWGPAAAWGQGSAPISRLARSGKCWRITRGEPHLPPRAPCRTSGAAHTLSRDHTQTAPGAALGRRRHTSCVDVPMLPTNVVANRTVTSRLSSSTSSYCSTTSPITCKSHTGFF